MIDWDRLPGPDRLLRQVELAVAEGANVCLLVPSTAPHDLPDVLFRRLLADAEYQGFDVRFVPGLLAKASPSEALRDLFGGQTAGRLSPHHMVDETWFGGRVVVAGTNGRESAWAAWREFLNAYAPSCRERSLRSIVRFLLVVGGTEALSPPSCDSCLVIRQWAGTVTRTDLEVYADRLLDDIRWTPLDRRIAATLIAEVALPDITLVPPLASLSLSDLLNHRRLGEVIRQQFPTPPCPDDAEVDWAEGLLDEPRRCCRVRHPSLDAWDNNGHRLHQRIWQGVVREVMPLIEELKMALVRDLESWCQSSDLLLREARDLSGIATRCVSDPNARQRLAAAFDVLWDVRCDVAHLKFDVHRLRKLLHLAERIFDDQNALRGA